MSAIFYVLGYLVAGAVFSGLLFSTDSGKALLAKKDEDGRFMVLVVGVVIWPASFAVLLVSSFGHLAQAIAQKIGGAK